MNEKVEAAVQAGPKKKHLAEAAWLIDNGGLDGTLSKPARAAFELGVALAQGVAHSAWKQSAEYQSVVDAVGADAPRVAAASRTVESAGPAEVAGVSSTDIRAWARVHGYAVNERGRLSEEVKQAYAQAAQPPAAPVRAKASGAAASAADRRAAREAARAAGAKPKNRRDPVHATAPPSERHLTMTATVTPAPKPASRRRGAAVQAGEASF